MAILEAGVIKALPTIQTRCKFLNLPTHLAVIPVRMSADFCRLKTSLPQIALVTLFITNMMLYLLLATLLLALTSTRAQMCNIPGTCLGNELDFTVTNTPEECLEFCRSTQGCYFFTHDSSIDMCIAFEDCPEVGKANKNAEYGIFDQQSNYIQNMVHNKLSY